MLVTETTGEIGETEIYSTGANKFGQLGIGELSDCQELTKIGPLSNLMYKKTENSDAVAMKVNKLACGLDHCLMATDMGVVFEWGANNRGQLGNKRRHYSEHPLIVKLLNDKSVVDLACGDDGTAVILQSVNKLDTTN